MRSVVKQVFGNIPFITYIFSKGVLRSYVDHRRSFMFQVRSHTTEAQQWCKTMVDGESTVIVFTRYFKLTQNLPLYSEQDGWRRFVFKIHSRCQKQPPNKSTDINVEWERWKNLFLVPFAEYIFLFIAWHSSLDRQPNDVFFQKTIPVGKRRKNIMLRACLQEFCRPIRNQPILAQVRRKVLSLVSKVFERCIYNHLIDHFHQQDYELQQAFFGRGLQLRRCCTSVTRFSMYLKNKEMLMLSILTSPKCK